MVDGTTLGATLEGNLNTIVEEAKNINTNTPNVLGNVLVVSQKSGKVEAANASAMKAFQKYAQVPLEGARAA